MMIRRIILLSGLLWAAPLLSALDSPRQTIRNVEVRGNIRVPTATIRHYITATPGTPFSDALGRKNLRELYALGLFQKLDILTTEAGEGQIDVIYEVVEQPFVSGFTIEGLAPGQKDQIERSLKEEKLAIQIDAPFNPGVAGKIASHTRSYLRARKYPLAEVRILTEQELPGTARVRLAVNPGPQLDIGEVRFSGNRSIAASDLVKQLKYTRPAQFLTPWASGSYSMESAAMDFGNVRNYYLSKGFAAVQIGKPQIVARDFPRPYRVPLPKINGPKQKIALLIPIIEGPVYKMISVKSEGGTKLATVETAGLITAIHAPSTYNYSLLENTRQKIVDALGHYGYALAQVELEQKINDAERTVSVVYRISQGNPVAIGRILFEGNKKIREKFLRRELVPREGEIFDSNKLDASIKRLNRSGMIQEVRRADVMLALNEQTKNLDITFKIKEKDRQGIYGTGGTGGIGGGYLGILYTAFDLLGLGESLSLQMDGGASQSNMLLNIVGSRFLGLPFTMGLSVFHRLTNFNIASILPDASDLIHLLRHRSTGMGLSGAYPITSKMQVGLATQFAKISVTEEAADGSVAQKTVQNRTELSPNFGLDATHGIGPEMRGTKFAFTSSWAGKMMLRSVDSTAQSVRFSQYIKDPLTKDRNSFAFRFQAARIRPHNGIPLTLDRRFYPGDEIVRGFDRGGLTPWAYDSSGNPTPAGADTVLGVSLEYRIPIQGPLSAAAFFDLGWSGLSKKNVDSDTASRVIDEANRVLRGSMGGELRLQLPVLKQPGRFIFSFNPLRLGSLIQGKKGLLKLVDPRKSFHFALGDRF